MNFKFEHFTELKMECLKITMYTAFMNAPKTYLVKIF